MHPLVAEYRSLPRSAVHLPNPAAQARKVEIVRALDDDANQDDVSALLLEVLRDAAEPTAVRAEAVEVVGLYIDESSALWRELFGEVLRIHADASEDAVLRSGAESFANWIEQSLAA